MANIAKYLSMDAANVKFDNNYEIRLTSLAGEHYSWLIGLV